MSKPTLKGAASPEPVARTAYLRAIDRESHAFHENYHFSDRIGSLASFLQQRVYQLPPPAPQHLYVLSIPTPADEELLDWLLSESQPLTPKELEDWKLCRRRRGVVRLRRSDFHVYLTRRQTKSKTGQALLKRLVSEGVTYFVMSPADVRCKLQNLSAHADVPDSPSGMDTAVSLDLKALDDYLMLIRSDYLVDSNTAIYSRYQYLSPDDLSWTRAVRDGVPERSADRDEKFDYSYDRLADRWAGRIKQRCDCSGQHHRCPRDVDSGPQWHCICGGPCKRNEACRKGMNRAGHAGYAHGRRAYGGSWPTQLPNVLLNKKIHSWSSFTAEDFCSARVFGDKHGLGRQGGMSSEDPKAIEDWKKLWLSVEFSGDWKTE